MRLRVLPKPWNTPTRASIAVATVFAARCEHEIKGVYVPGEHRRAVLVDDSVDDSEVHRQPQQNVL